MASFAVITACYTNIAIAVSAQREAGILKRIDGSPLSRGIVPRLPGPSRTLWRIALLLVAVTAAFGRGLYRASVPGGLTLASFLVMLVVGAATFCALGLAVTAVIPNADAAPAIVQATILPLLFLSGVFIPFGNNAPSWILWVARIFPVGTSPLGCRPVRGHPFQLD